MIFKCKFYKFEMKEDRLPVPEVWSPEGPVLDERVLPVLGVHWKSPVLSDVQPHKSSSNVQSRVPLLCKSIIEIFIF